MHVASCNHVVDIPIQALGVTGDKIIRLAYHFRGGDFLCQEEMEQVHLEEVVQEQEEVWEEQVVEEEWEEPDQVLGRAVSVCVRPVEPLPPTRLEYPATKSSVLNAVLQWFENR